jgi:hypothetical protein
MSAWGIGRQAAQPALANVDTSRQRAGRRQTRARGRPPAEGGEGGNGGNGNGGNGNGGNGDGSKLQTFIGTPVKWIPAEVVTLFTASIAAFVTAQQDPAWGLFAGFLILTPIAVVFGAFAQSGPSGVTQKVLVAAALSIPAFAIWSFVVPSSGWEDINWIADHPVYTTVIAAAAGYLYSLFAEGVTKWTAA